VCVTKPSYNTAVTLVPICWTEGAQECHVSPRFQPPPISLGNGIPDHWLLHPLTPPHWTSDPSSSTFPQSLIPKSIFSMYVRTSKPHSKHLRGRREEGFVRHFLMLKPKSGDSLRLVLRRTRLKSWPAYWLSRYYVPGFPQSLQANTGTVPWNSSLLPPSKFLPTNHLWSLSHLIPL